MAQLMNGKAKTIKQRQSFTKLATLKVPAMRKMSTALKNELQRRMTCRLVMAGSTIRTVQLLSLHNYAHFVFRRYRHALGR